MRSRWLRAMAWATVGLLGSSGVRAEETVVSLVEQLLAAEAARDDATVIGIGRELATRAPALPGVRLRLAAALERTGAHRAARAELERVAEMGASALDSDLTEFGRRRDRALRERLAANAAPLTVSTVAFELADADLFPESLAFDAVDGATYVGSLRQRKIVRRAADGTVTDWIEPGRDGLGAVVGIKIDPARRELWATSCNDPGGSPAIVPADEATLGRGALYRFALPGGELISLHAAGDRERPVCFNDLALTADGTVYATGTGGVWRLAPGAERIELWRAEAGALNGIAVSTDGRDLYVANHLEGLYRVDPATAVAARLEHPATTTLVGVDGLYLVDRTLVAIQNGLRSGPQRVLQAFLSESGTGVTCVELLERNHPAHAVPTTGAVVDGALVYVATSQLDRIGADGQPTPAPGPRPNVFLRLPLAESCAPAPPPLRIAELDPCAIVALDTDGRIEATRRKLYETTCAAALWFDGLFGEQQQVGAAQRTSGRVELSALDSEFDGLKFRARFHVKTRFPNLEEKLEAFFGRDDADDFLRDRNEGLALRSQFAQQLLDEDDWVAGLGYSLPGSFRTKSDVRVGARGSSSPEVFVQGRFRFNTEIGERSSFRFRESLFWTNRDGFGATTAFDTDRILGRHALIRWANVATWSEATEGLDWRSAAIVYQNLEERRGMAYELFVRGETEAEVSLQEYGARAIYRQPLFGSKWLYGEAVAGYGWPREELSQPREGSATVGVGVELYFGRER